MQSGIEEKTTKVQKQETVSSKEKLVTIVRHPLTSPIYVAPALDQPYQKVVLQQIENRLVANLKKDYSIQWTQSVRIQPSDLDKLKKLSEKISQFIIITETEYKIIIKDAEENAKKIGIRYQNKECEYAAFVRQTIEPNSNLLFAGEFYIRNKNYQGDADFDKYALRFEIGDIDHPDCLILETSNKNAVAFMQHLPSNLEDNYQFKSKDIESQVATANFKIKAYHVKDTDIYFVVAVSLRKINVDEIIGYDYSDYYWSDPKKNPPYLFERSGKIIDHKNYECYAYLFMRYKEQDFVIKDLLSKFNYSIEINYCIPMSAQYGKIFISPTLLKNIQENNPNVRRFNISNPRLVAYRDYAAFENSLLSELKRLTLHDAWKFYDPTSHLIVLQISNQAQLTPCLEKLKDAGIRKIKTQNTEEGVELFVHQIEVYDNLILQINVKPSALRKHSFLRVDNAILSTNLAVLQNHADEVSSQSINQLPVKK